MRKILSIIVALASTLTLTFAPVSITLSSGLSLGPQEASASGCHPVYDFDGDGDVDGADIGQLAATKWGSTLPSDLGLDYNQNGKIDVGDIVYGGIHLCDTPVGPFGATVQGGITTEVQDLAVSAGVRWVRIGVGWNGVEPTNVDLTNPSNGNWPDSRFRAFELNGISPVFLMMDAPDWAAENEKCGPLKSDKYDDFREFIYAAAARYDGDADYNDDGTIDGPPMPYVQLYEFYNEPDLNPDKTDLRFGGCWGDSGSDYAKLMREAYLAIKGTPTVSSANTVANLSTLTGANPSATVMLGGLAYDSQYNNPDTPTSGCYNWQSQNFFNYYFLEEVLGTTFGDGTTGGDYFDTVNFHYHRKASPCWAPWGVETLGKANYLQTRLDAYGYDGVNKPLKSFAVTEDGEKRAPSPDYSDEDQARYVVMSFIRALAGKFEVLTWFSFDYFQDHLGRVFGLLDQNNNEQLGYDALKVLTEKFAGAQFVADLSTSTYERYRFSVGGIEKTAAWTTGGSNTLSFSGSQIRVYDKYGTLVNQGNGSLSVTISADPRYIEVTP